MGNNRIASGELGRRLVAVGFCENWVQATILIGDWALSGEVKAFSPLATVNGKLERNYELPVRAWRDVKYKGPGTFGRYDMERGCVELFTNPKVHAPKIEFELSENAAALIAVVDVVAVPAKRPHPSNLDAKDAPLLEEMGRLIASGEVTGPNPAALRVADRAEGASLEAKVRRLERKYKKAANG